MKDIRSVESKIESNILEDHLAFPGMWPELDAKQLELELVKQVSTDWLCSFDSTW